VAKRAEIKATTVIRGRGARVDVEKRRKVYAKDDKAESFDANLPEVAQQLLQKSRNLKADINNPNNPYYIGRPGNKGIESILTSKLKKQCLVTPKAGESDGVEEDPRELRERDRATRAREFDSMVKDYDHSPEKHEDVDHDFYGYGDEYDYKYKREDRERYIDSAAYY